MKNTKFEKFKIKMLDFFSLIDEEKSLTLEQELNINTQIKNLIEKCKRINE